MIRKLVAGGLALLLAAYFPSALKSEINNKVGLQDELITYSIKTNYFLLNILTPILIPDVRLNLDIKEGEKYEAVIDTKSNRIQKLFGISYNIKSRGKIIDGKLSPLETLASEKKGLEYKSRYHDGIIELELVNDSKSERRIIKSEPEDIATLIYNLRLTDLKGGAEFTKVIYFNDTRVDLFFVVHEKGEGYIVDIYKNSSKNKREFFKVEINSGHDITSFERLLPKKEYFKAKIQ